MHELALSESIIDLVVNCARQERIARVSRVVVEIGVAASVEPQALLFCFSIAAADTVAAGAELVIDRIGLQASCEDCGSRYAPETLFSPCPDCGGFARRILAGREMRVVSIAGE
jgi:hydrogenase nickel incorporation protein HypA/HybF